MIGPVTSATSTAAAAATVEMLMSASASGGIVLTLTDQQNHINDLNTIAQPQHASVTSSSSSSPQCHISTVLPPTVGQLVLCPSQQFTYQSVAPLNLTASATQMCTVLSPVTSPAVSVLQVPAAVIPSVQLMPAAALGLPVTPVFIAGDVAIGPPSFFMVPN